MRIAMIGTGYVGLVSGACFAEMGHDVTCLDIDNGKIELLRRGKVPIYEPGLAEYIHRNSQAGRLHFTNDIAEAVPGCDAVFIAVGTPARANDGHVDTKYVYAAAESLASIMNGYTVIVNKSTVPIATNKSVGKIIARTRGPEEFSVVSNPEFLREGAAINDFMNPDRIVVGSRNERALDVMRQIYQPLTDMGTLLIETDPESAELIKYAANAFLAVKISFINEIADICEKVGADIDEVSHAIGSDSRISAKFLQAGPGYGGSCFPKDTSELYATALKVGVGGKIVKAAIDSNNLRKRKLAYRVCRLAGGSLDNKVIAVLGITFKAGTDDVRESPALELIPALQAMGAHIRAYDPQGRPSAEPLLPGIEWADDSLTALKEANVALILTEWNEFRTLSPQVFLENMQNNLVVDLRNLHNVSTMRDEIGRASCRERVYAPV